MSNLARLLPILKLLEDKCAAKVGESVKKRNSLEAQLRQIKHYRAEYQEVKPDVPVLLANAKMFVQRLDQSIDETEQRLVELNDSVNSDAAQYNAARARYKIVEKLIQKEREISNANVDEQHFNWQSHCNPSDDSHTPQG